MKKTMVALLVVMLVAGAVFAQGGKESAPAASSTAPAKVIKLKLAENQPANNPISKAMQKFADLVKEKTNGSVEVDVYLDAQLGSENETIDQIQAGTLDLARINTSALASTADEVGVFTLPYIFTSMDQKYKVLDGAIGQNIIKSLEKYNMIGLEYWEAGSRNFYSTKKPIKSVADLKGMKVRVQQSEVAIKMVELLGGAATPMSYGEVYQGLQTGVIDAAENDFVSYYTSGHYEVAKYYSLDGHMAPPAMLLMSKSVYDKLDASQQKAIKEAAREAALWQRKAMDDFQNESRAAVEKAGCQIFEVDTKEFQNAVTPIYAKYPQYASVIKAIQEVK
jgi:tripartite ATP-independent transporter DctP family solute receptor